MNTLGYILPYDSPSVIDNFSFQNLKLQRFDTLNSNVDFIPFDGLRIGSISDDVISKEFLFSLTEHPNYKISKENPNLPVVFFHEHEPLNSYDFNCLINLVTKELNLDSKKIILIDTNLIKRDGFINQPLVQKLKQFNFKVYKNSIEKNKKFTFLNNRANKLRFQVFDKVLKNYENDIDKLRNENIVTFRNYKDDDEVSSNINDILEYIKFSSYYKFYNDFDFYKQINLPWVIDEFPIGGGFQSMFAKQNKLYGESYFSIILETDWNQCDLDTDRYHGNFIPFSEKTIIPFCSNNLPFVIHRKEYYQKFENIGFDFSYLKKIFNIDYKKNTLKENFNSLDKFITYFKNKSLDVIKNDYESVYDILENNRSIIKKIENKEIDKNVFEFIEKVKKEKYE